MVPGLVVIGMSMPTWIVGDWATGRMLHEIPAPAKGTTFGGDMRGSSATLALDPREPSHRRLREHLRADMTRYVAAIGSTAAQPLVALAGGPILLHTADNDDWRWDVGGPDSYPDRRLLIAPQDVKPTLDAEQPVYHLRGTWRQIANQALALLPRSGRTMPRMAVTVGELAGGGYHEIDVPAVDLESFGALLDKVNSRADGVETRFLPWWEGDTLEDGYFRTEIGVGQDDDPYVAGPARIPITIGAPGGTVEVTSWAEDGSGRGTSSWVSGGRGSDQVIIQSWADWGALNAGVPPLDVVDTSAPNDSDRTALGWRAADLLADAIVPLTEVGLRVRVGGVPDPWSFGAGSWVDLLALPSQDVVPAGRHQMRVVSRSWAASDPEWATCRLVGVRPMERW